MRDSKLVPSQNQIKCFTCDLLMSKKKDEFICTKCNSVRSFDDLLQETAFLVFFVKELKRRGINKLVLTAEDGETSIESKSMKNPEIFSRFFSKILINNCQVFIDNEDKELHPFKIEIGKAGEVFRLNVTNNGFMDAFVLSMQIIRKLKKGIGNNDFLVKGYE